MLFVAGIIVIILGVQTLAIAVSPTLPVVIGAAVQSRLTSSQSPGQIGNIRLCAQPAAERAKLFAVPYLQNRLFSEVIVIEMCGRTAGVNVTGHQHPQVVTWECHP